MNELNFSRLDVKTASQFRGENKNKARSSGRAKAIIFVFPAANCPVEEPVPSTQRVCGIAPSSSGHPRERCHEVLLLWDTRGGLWSGTTSWQNELRVPWADPHDRVTRLLIPSITTQCRQHFPLDFQRISLDRFPGMEFPLSYPHLLSLSYFFLVINRKSHFE